MSVATRQVNVPSNKYYDGLSSHYHMFQQVRVAMQGRARTHGRTVCVCARMGRTMRTVRSERGKPCKPAGVVLLCTLLCCCVHSCAAVYTSVLLP